MRHPRRRVLAGCSILALGTGCELIAGIDDRYPPPASSGTGTGASTGTGGAASTSAGVGGGGGGSSACGTTGAIIPVPDSATQFCSHTDTQGFCPDATSIYYGQDGNTQIHDPTYQWNAGATEKTLTDCITGLVWQAEPTTTSDLTWDGANTLCNDLTYGGISNWRLPSRRELISLLDLGRPSMGNGTAPVFPIELQPLVEPAPANPVYWTSSEYASAPTDTAWAVRLISSRIEFLPKNSTPEGRALCVSGPNRYEQPVFDVTATTVADTSTGLMWERTVGATRRWSTALGYCNLLDLGGYQDWRLPTLKELAYLADDSLTVPALDPNAFPGTPSEEYWSSTPSSGDPTLSWTVHFDSGRAQTAGTNISFRARCVRTAPVTP